MDRVVRGDVGDVVRSDLEVVEVGLQPVAALDRGDCLVVGVHHEVLALAEAEREHVALPEGQVALAFVALHAEIIRGQAPGELVEPDEPALRRVDQRSVAARPGAVGGEDVACRGVAVWRGDGHDRRLDAGQRVEALIVGGRRRGVGERSDGCCRVGGIDAKVKGDSLAGGRRTDHRVHEHLLAGRERRVRDEARAVALRVGDEAAAVMPAAATDDGHTVDLGEPGRAGS